MTIEVEPTLSPRLITVPSPSTEMTMQYLADDIRNWEDEVPNLVYKKLLSASGKESLGGGVTVGITALLENAKLAFEPRTTSITSGTITTANPAGTTLIDATASFIVDGVEPGATIINFTDKSVATVKSIDSAIQLTHYALKDGADNTWEMGDEYKIWNVIQCDATGGNLVAIDVGGSNMSPIFPTAFTQVIRTSSASATIAELEITNLQYLIESARGTHASYGNIIYWSPHDGNDSYIGDSPERAVATFVRSHNLAADNNNDVIFAIANDPSGITTCTENLVITKSAISVRGPGENFKIKPTADVDVVYVTGDYVSISGMRIEGSGVGTTRHGIHIYESDFFKISDVHVLSADNCGIRMYNCQRGKLHNIDVQSCKKHGLNFDKVIYSEVDGFLISHYNGNTLSGSGVYVENISHGIHIGPGADIHQNNQYGLYVDATSQEVFLSPQNRVFNNGVANILDLGIEGTLGTDLGFEKVSETKYAIESARYSHPGYGISIYWDPIEGLDTNDGIRPDRPVKTFVVAHGLAVSGRSDIIYIITNEDAVVDITERITITKHNLYIRGPGRNIRFKPTDKNGGDIITVNADRFHLDGVKVETASTTLDATNNDRCIVINGTNSNIEHCWITRGKCAIVYYGGDYHSVRHCDLEWCWDAAYYMEDGLLAVGSPRDSLIEDSNIYYNTIGVRYTALAAPASSTRLNRIVNCNIYNNTTGIDIGSNVSGTLVDEKTTTFNNTTDIVDNSINSYIYHKTSRDIMNLQGFIETLHTHSSTGKVYYWSPYDGDDSYSGTYADKAFATFAKALSMCENGTHDVIFAVSDDPVGTTYIDEILTINKDTVSLRCPGRNFVFRPTTGAGNTITINSYGVEISGFTIDGSMSTNTNGVYTNESFTLIRNVWIDGLDGDAITIDGGDYNMVDNVFSHHNPGGSGIIVTGDSDHTTITDSHIGSNSGDGIYIEITDVNKHEVNIIGNTTIHKNSGYGVRIVAPSKSVIIHPEVQIFANTLGDILDNGTSTYDGPSEVAAKIWDVPTLGHTTAGTFGQYVRKKLLTVGKFLGLK